MKRQSVFMMHMLLLLNFLNRELYAAILKFAS